MKLKSKNLSLFTSNELLTVKDNRNSKSWQQAFSILEIDVWDRMLDRRQSFPFEINQESCQLQVKSSQQKDQLLITANWQVPGITIPISIRLKNNYIQYLIKPNGIIERNSKHFRLLGLKFLPGFGAAKRNQEGWMLMPNASGVICKFAKQEQATHRNFIYMHQQEWESWCALPVFGMKHGSDAAFLGIIESGEWDTEIVSELNSNGTDNHIIYPYFHFRYNKTDKMDPVSRIIRYEFLAGQDADYPGMATVYRQYLSDDKKAKTLKEKSKRSAKIAYETEAHTCKIFMAMKRITPDGSGRYAAFTTFKQARTVMNAFKKAGIEKMSFELVGWNPAGHDGMYPTRLPVDKRIGGEEELDKTIKFAKTLGYRVGVHDNYVDMYACSPDYDENIIMKDRDNELVIGGEWGGGQMYFICGSQMLKFAKRDMPKMKELGLTGIFYMDAMPRVGRDCFDSSHNHHPGRRADGDGIIEVFKFAAKTMKGHPIGSENVFGYTLPYQDFAGHILTSVPQGGLPEAFNDEAVPFLHMVAHGLLKYHLADPRQTGSEPNEATKELILKEIEYGAMPRYEFSYKDKYKKDRYLHFGQWDTWLSVMKKQHQALCQDLVHLQYEFIVNHSRNGKGVSKTSYSDGSIVTVDYNKKTYQLNNGPIKTI